MFGLPVTKLEDYILDELYWRRDEKREGIHFNELFRILKKKGAVGSYTTLSKTLGEMLDQGFIKVREEKHPGLSKKVYHITEKGANKIEGILILDRETLLLISEVMRKTGYTTEKTFKENFNRFFSYIVRELEKSSKVQFFIVLSLIFSFYAVV